MSDRRDWYELCSEATPYPVESNSRQPLISHKQRYVAKYGISKRKYSTKIDCEMINRVYLFSSTKSMIKRKKKKVGRTPISIYEKPRSFQFACCGINGSSNYGTSWWRLQEVGRRELVVPLSCCTLNNVNQTDSFLNPEPANLTLCQALNPAEHQYARHTTVRIINEDVVKRVRKK